MQLNLETDYAIRCVLFLADKEDCYSAAQISREVSITQSHAQKLLRKLRQHGYVVSEMGSCGGYRLAMPPEEIYMLKVIEDMEGTIKINRCLEPDGYCSNNATDHCPMHVFYDKVQRSLVETFGSVSLRQIIDQSC